MLSNTLRHLGNMERMLQTRQTASEKRNKFFYTICPSLDLISAHFHCTVSSLLKSKQTQREQTALRNPKCFLHISLERCPQRACGRYSEKQSLV